MRRLYPSVSLAVCLLFSATSLFANTLSEALKADSRRINTFSAALAQTPPDPRTLEPDAVSLLLRPFRSSLKRLGDETSTPEFVLNRFKDAVAGAENSAQFASESNEDRARLNGHLEKLSQDISALAYDLESAADVSNGQNAESEGGEDKAHSHPVNQWMPGAVEALEGFSFLGEAESAVPSENGMQVSFKNGKSMLIKEDGTFLEKVEEGEYVNRGKIRPSSKKALAHKKGVADIDFLWAERDEVIGNKNRIDFDTGERTVTPVFGIEGNAKFTTSPIDAAVFAVIAPAMTFAYGTNEVKKAVRTGIKEEVHDKARVKEIKNPIVRAAAEFGLNVAMSKPVGALLNFGPKLPTWIMSLRATKQDIEQTNQIAKDIKTVFTVDDKAVRDEAVYRLSTNSLKLGKKILGSG
jgi:hypothetical protein